MRTILHVDLNNFFASVECLDDPSIRDKPVAVCGDKELRHGIVLAKNYIAKAAGVKTGYTIADAKRICPGLVCVLPHMERYMQISRQAKMIYNDYSDKVESFGIDECWLQLYKNDDGPETADVIRERIKKELGVTASVGVSYNKIFAKMGSDYKKPDATTVITEDNYKALLWGLPVSDMMFVGRATEQKLKLYGINTIGDLANADASLLKHLLGKCGVLLHRFANGQDNSAVSDISAPPPLKSIGNSTTTMRDMITDDDVRVTFMELCECVSERLRAHKMKCMTVAIDERNSELFVFTRQKTLPSPVYTAEELFSAAMELHIQNRGDKIKLRSIGVRASSLYPEIGMQLSFYDNEKKQKREAAARAADKINSKFGRRSLVHGVTMIDKSLTSFIPKDEIT
ncbi:MAG: DNA polymerase IV [Clostridia bacterium]|nr:DNA polymerase IV [Clostridia bacterium]